MVLERPPGFLKEFTLRSRLVVHSDSDLYSSTLFTLANLNTLLVPGAVVIFRRLLDAYTRISCIFALQECLLALGGSCRDELGLCGASGIRVRLVAMSDKSSDPFDISG
jgi:hypothetical protein